MGYENLFLYSEGMPVWEEFEYPSIKGPGYEAKVETVKITPQDLSVLMKSGIDDFVIVDVRDESEYAEGHIPGAINIPVAAFALRSGVLDKKKRIIVYCKCRRTKQQGLPETDKAGLQENFSVYLCGLDGNRPEGKEKNEHFV